MLVWTALLLLLLLLLLQSLTEIRLIDAGKTRFTLNGDQDVFHAEEHANITLTWTYRDQTERAPNSLFIDLMNLNPTKKIYFCDSKEEAEPYTDDSYRGRLQCDLQLAMKGHIECLLTDLRLSDSGTYQWVVVVDKESHVKKCRLEITAAMRQTEDNTPNPASRSRYGLYCSLGFFTVAIFALSIFTLQAETTQI